MSLIRYASLLSLFLSLFRFIPAATVLETVAPPLSADPAPAYTDLPSFGSITWETRRLPWVDEGPYAGISGAAMTPHSGKIYVVGGFLPRSDETNDQFSRRTSRWTWVY